VNATATVKMPEPVSCQLIGKGLNGRSWEKAAIAPVVRRMQFQASGPSRAD